MTLRLRPSALSLASKCPGSVEMTARYGQRSASDAMTRGTRLDALLELALLGDDVDPEIADTWEWVQSVLPSGERETQAHRSIAGEGYVLSGTADLWIDGTDGAVVDFKSGSGRALPPLEHDLQLLAYGAMLAAGRGCVRIMRVLIDSRTVDDMMCDVNGITAQVDEACRGIVAHQRRYERGTHCDMCRVSHVCPLATHDASPLLPATWSRWDMATEPASDECALELARAAAEATRMADAAKHALKLRGLPVVDRASGRTYGPAAVETTKVAASAARYIAKLWGESAAAAAAASGITLAGIGRAAKTAGVDAAEMLAELAASGFVSQEIQARWAWRKTDVGDGVVNGW